MLGVLGPAFLVIMLGKNNSGNWLLLCISFPVQLASLHSNSNPRPLDARRNLIHRNLVCCPAAAVDATNEYMFKGIFQDPAVMREFLSQLLIGEDKIFLADTKLIEISYIPTEYFQNAPPRPRLVFPRKFCATSWLIQTKARWLKYRNIAIRKVNTWTESGSMLRMQARILSPQKKLQSKSTTVFRHLLFTWCLFGLTTQISYNPTLCCHYS